VLLNLRYYPETYIEGVRGITKILSINGVLAEIRTVPYRITFRRFSVVSCTLTLSLTR
jgi:hypothetical protein